LLHGQEGGSRQLRTNAPGQFARQAAELGSRQRPTRARLWAFAGHETITPEVAFLIPAGPIKSTCCLARPGFRLWIPRSAGSSQPSFCPYTLPRISFGW